MLKEHVKKEVPGLKTTVKKDEPLWRGPEVDGVTQSMLQRFLIRRERFRVRYVLGLRPTPKFDLRTGYGDMWHACEEALAAKADVLSALTKFSNELMVKYPFQREEIEKWTSVCCVQFPIYVDWWAKHPDVEGRTPIFQEQVFDVPYKLPSGRTIRLRGKWDSVDLIDGGVWLQENKTKGQVNEAQLKRQLRFDLQTMLYLVALEESYESDGTNGHFSGVPGIKRLPTAKKGEGPRIKGVGYNVIRRPLSGGKGTIVQHKPTKSNPHGESKAEYWARLGGVINKEPQDYFWRWKIEVSPKEIEAFRRTFLDPVLEALCNWWEVVEYWHKKKDLDSLFSDSESGHFRMPFGVYSPLMDRHVGQTDEDEYLENGSTVGLQRAERLFEELE